MFEQEERQKKNVANLGLKMSLPFSETESIGLLGNVPNIWGQQAFHSYLPLNYNY